MLLTPRVATWCGISAIFMWAAMLGLIRQVTVHFGTDFGITLIYSLSTLLLLVIFRFPNFKKISKTYLILASILFVTYEMCYAFAIGHAQSSQQAIEISLVNYLWPSLTMLALVLFKHLKFHWMLLIGMAISLSGLVYIQIGDAPFSFEQLSENTRTNPLSYALAFIGASLWSIYCALTKSLGSQENPIAFFFCLVTCALWFKLFTFSGGIPNISWTSTHVIYLIGAATSLGLGYGAWNVGMIRGNVSTLVTMSYFSPVIAAFIAMFILQQRLSLSFWQGTILVTLGSFVCWISSNWSAFKPKIKNWQRFMHKTHET